MCVVNFLYSNGVSFYGFIKNYSKISTKFSIKKKALNYLSRNSKGLLVISNDNGLELSTNDCKGGKVRLLILS